jgi:hypothetical protein
VAVVGTVVGAGLVLLGATRVWSTETVAQPPPLSPQEIVHTGASLAPALPALGLVALAGAGGLLATRGIARRFVGVLLVAAAAGIVVLVAGRGAGWPVACLIGALIVGATGALAVRDGARWPVMGARYSRAAPARHRPEPAEQTSPAELWDAIERGEDPTAR